MGTFFCFPHKWVHLIMEFSDVKQLCCIFKTCSNKIHKSPHSNLWKLPLEILLFILHFAARFFEYGSIKNCDSGEVDNVAHL